MAIPQIYCRTLEKGSPAKRRSRKRVRENEGRIPLVLTYHPLTSRVKHILLNNFNILTTVPVTATIFPAPPVVEHRRDLSLQDVLVHTSDRSQTEELSHVDIPAAALAYTHHPTSMYVDPRAQPPSGNTLPANQGTSYTASRAVDAPSYTLERPVVLYTNDSANIFGVSKKTLVVSQSQSTLTLPVIVYQTFL